MISPAVSKTASQNIDDITSARRVLKIEADALLMLSENLGTSFVRALDILGDTQGRVIVSGMGKSGHIGKKIAATFASTGTPSYFVHPAEASHGDLGMITTLDSIFALSNSGETSELADIVAYSSRFNIPLVAMTAVDESTLAKAANAAVILPEPLEACPMGLAPTTSSTMMLALGDAMAVTLLERKNFSSADFKMLHPGGKLGHRLMKVADIMHSARELPVVRPEDQMSEVILEMTAKRFGCVGILDLNGRLKGIITDGDLRRHMGKTLLETRAADIMTHGVRTIDRDALISEALSVMNTLSITNLFVVDEEEPVGIIHIHDCLRAGVA